MMGYIITCENCECRSIEMVKQNGEFMAKGIGEIFVGTIALDQISNKDMRDISFEGSETLRRESIKKFLLLDSDEVLCHFEVNESELKKGEKKIKMQVQSDSSAIHYIIICYSIITNKGIAYLLPNFDELKRWANEFDIGTYEVLDSIGKLLSVEYF